MKDHSRYGNKGQRDDLEREIITLQRSLQATLHDMLQASHSRRTVLEREYESKKAELAKLQKRRVLAILQVLFAHPQIQVFRRVRALTCACTRKSSVAISRLLSTVVR